MSKMFISFIYFITKRLSCIICIFNLSTRRVATKKYILIDIMSLEQIKKITNLLKGKTHLIEILFL